MPLDIRNIMPETRNRLVGRTVPSEVPEDGLGLWQIAPLPLAKVNDDGAIHWNPACRNFLQETLGGSALRWRRWLHAAMVRLRTSDLTVDRIAAGPATDTTLEVRLGPRRPGDRFQLVGLAHPAGQVSLREEIVESVGTLSHELRTPLASMLNSLDLLANEDAGPLNRDQQHFLSLARRNIGRLDRLVTDLLELPDRPGAAATPFRRLVDLGPLVREVAQSHVAACESADLTLDIRDLPDHLLAQVDPDQLQRMVHNILGNAVKYSEPQGRIRIELSVGDGFAGTGESRLAAQLARSMHSVRITIEDDGLGLDPGRLEEMFGPFVRAPEATARQIPGAGLGLHITRQMVRSHGGRIRLDSESGCGLTVTIELPANRSTELLCKGWRGLDGTLRDQAGQGRSMIALYVARRGAENSETGFVATFLDVMPDSLRETVPGPALDLGCGTVGIVVAGIPDAHRWHEAWQAFRKSAAEAVPPGDWRFLPAHDREQRDWVQPRPVRADGWKMEKHGQGATPQDGGR